MYHPRRDWLKTCSAAGAALLLGNEQRLALAAQVDKPNDGERPEQDQRVQVVNPRGRVPISFIIDDSTCLVNLAHFGIPQFAEVFPDRYKQDWRSMPREIPDDFVRKFGDWCGEHNVRGKYSIVPYPACVGWVDRDMPGWSKRQLQDSIHLVQDRLAPSWDIHPEMVSHTWVIDTKTGRPYAERSKAFMENWDWSAGRSPDELTDYLSYALRILKNAGFSCEGITTPGGFGNRARRSLSLASLNACRDVFAAEIPHYFRHLYTDGTSVMPRVENASGLKTDDPQCVVSIIGCTGDWFGGWDGITIGDANRFVTPDLSAGRMVDVIERGEPAIMVCHWPGIYCNGDEQGFDIFKTVVQRLESRYETLHWMKLSEISRYWAAKHLTEIKLHSDEIRLDAPFPCDEFTLELGTVPSLPPRVSCDGKETLLQEVEANNLRSGTFAKNDQKTTYCFSLGRGKNTIRLS